MAKGITNCSSESGMKVVTGEFTVTGTNTTKVAVANPIGADISFVYCCPKGSSTKASGHSSYKRCQAWIWDKNNSKYPASSSLNPYMSGGFIHADITFYWQGGTNFSNKFYNNQSYTIVCPSNATDTLYFVNQQSDDNGYYILPQTYYYIFF